MMSVPAATVAVHEQRSTAVRELHQELGYVESRIKALSDE